MVCPWWERARCCNHQPRPQPRPGHPDDETSYDVLGPVDHALQYAAVPSEELYRKAVLVSGAVGQPPLKREMARPRDIPARPVLIGVKLFRNIQTRLVHEHSMRWFWERGISFGV